MLILWTITKNPSDAKALAQRMSLGGDIFVARPHAIGDGWMTPLAYCKSATDIEELRTIMKGKGLHCMPRRREDDPVIIETWV